MNSHITTTNTTRITKTNVTRDRGIGLLRSLVLVPYATQEPDSVTERTVEQNGDAVGQGKHDGHHHRRLGDEPQAGQPQFDAVPPVEEAAHPASLRCGYRLASGAAEPATSDTPPDE